MSEGQFIAGGVSSGLPSKLFVNPAQRVRILFGLVLCLALALWLSVGGQQLLHDPDTQWHIALGRDIWQLKSFPHVDTYSHSFAGTPWIAKEWLSQLILFGAYAVGGWTGVVLLGAGVLALVALLLYRRLSASLRPEIAAATVIAALALSSQAIIARPHMIALPLIILFVHHVWDAARAQKAPSFWLLGVMCLWANMHASFTFGFVVAFLSFLAFLNSEKSLTSRNSIRWIVFLGLCPVAAMAHPYGFDSIWSTISVAQSEALPFIQEWRAFSAPVDIAAEAVLLSLLAFLLIGRFRTDIFAALFLCLLLHLYLTHVRFIYLLFLLAPLVVVDDLARQFPAASFSTWSRKLGPSGFHGRLVHSFQASAVFILAASALLVLWAANSNDWGPRKEVLVTNALSAARAEGVTGNVLNHYDFGGGLILARVPTFIDGRADRLFQNGFMPEINASKKDGGGDILRKHLDQYTIGWTLLKVDDGRVDHLDRMSNWERIYQDEFAVVHRRKTPGPL